MSPRHRGGGYEGSGPIEAMAPPPAGPAPGAVGPIAKWIEPSPGRLWCARCLLENFTHDPVDPHILHGPTCAPTVNREAVTVMAGRALCIDHAVDEVREE